MVRIGWPITGHPRQWCKRNAAWREACLQPVQACSPVSDSSHRCSEKGSPRAEPVASRTRRRCASARITENLAALDRVITFLQRHTILLYRITSNLIPFASHPVNELAWWDEFRPQLTAIGHRIRDFGIRVSTHPGQLRC